MSVARSFAPAKINLTLHVTGQRGDGYHLLDSLVAFASVGDTVVARAAAGLSLRVTGPRAEGVPEDGRNLVLRAALLFEDGPGAALMLDKHLPPASGIGGGSSDAAAAVRALSQLWQVPRPAAGALAGLGADVPVCMDPRVVRMQGVGEVLTPLPTLPPVWAALINPGVEVPTPAVFAALESKVNPPMPEALPVWRSAVDLAAFLRTQRNDLEPPALACAPVIGDVLQVLGAQPECLLARMSGSGATCFGLFASAEDAERAVAVIAQDHPDWWGVASKLG